MQHAPANQILRKGSTYAAFRKLEQNVPEFRAFLAKHGEIVIKPLHGNGGKAIFKVGSDGANLSALIMTYMGARFGVQFPEKPPEHLPKPRAHGRA